MLDLAARMGGGDTPGMDTPVRRPTRSVSPSMPTEPDDDPALGLDWAMEQLARADAEEELVSARAHEDALLASFVLCGVEVEDGPCTPSRP